MGRCLLERVAFLDFGDSVEDILVKGGGILGRIVAFIPLLQFAQRDGLASIANGRQQFLEPVAVGAMDPSRSDGRGQQKQWYRCEREQ